MKLVLGHAFYLVYPVSSRWNPFKWHNIRKAKKVRPTIYQSSYSPANASGNDFSKLLIQGQKRLSGIPFLNVTNLSCLCCGLSFLLLSIFCQIHEFSLESMAPYFVRDLCRVTVTARSSSKEGGATADIEQESTA